MTDESKGLYASALRGGDRVLISPAPEGYPPGQWWELAQVTLSAVQEGRNAVIFLRPVEGPHE